jgi:hypothetical protein
MLDRPTDEWEIEVLATRPDGGLLGTPGFRASGYSQGAAGKALCAATPAYQRPLALGMRSCDS